MSFVIGIDIGSTAVKACLLSVGAGAKTVGRGSCSYPTERRGLAVLQDPDDWNRAAVSAVREACSSLSPEDKKKIAGISLSAQGGSAYPADRAAKPLGPAFTWMDREGTEEADELEKALGEAVRDLCGWGNSPTAVTSKILRIRRRDPGLFEKAAYFYTTEESVTGFLCGNYVTDPTGECITRLYDRGRGRYDPDTLSYLGIREEQLPTVAPCGSFAGKLLPDAAAALGLPDGIPVFVGAHDQYCASLGSGVTEPGQLLCATGTAWVLFGVSDTPPAAPPYPAWCPHPIPGRYGFMTSMSGCGGAIGAFAEASGSTPAELDRTIVSAGAEEMRRRTKDLFVCPLPPGQSIPHREGVCVPLSESRAPAAETFLAAMESVAFEARILCEAFAAGGAGTDTVVMSGGASKSPLWRGILAAVMNGRRLLRLCEADAPALGAALVAAASSGAFSDLSEAARSAASFIPVGSDPRDAEYYENKYLEYRRFALVG